MLPEPLNEFTTSLCTNGNTLFYISLMLLLGWIIELFSIWKATPQQQLIKYGQVKPIIDFNKAVTLLYAFLNTFYFWQLEWTYRSLKEWIFFFSNNNKWEKRKESCSNKKLNAFLIHWGILILKCCLYENHAIHSIPVTHQRCSPTERVNRGDLEKVFKLCDKLPNAFTFNESHQCSAGIAQINK